MKLTVISRHQSFSDRTKEYATKKAGKLERFHDGIQHAEVILGVDGQEYVAEMLVTVRHGGKLVAKEVSGDIYSAIDLLVDKVERLLKKQKNRIRDRAKSGRMPPPREHLPEEREGEEVEVDGHLSGD